MGEQQAAVSVCVHVLVCLHWCMCLFKSPYFVFLFYALWPLCVQIE